MRRSGPAQCGGLTLIEVLVALAILGVSAGVLMTAVSRCLAVVRISKNYYTARHVLDLGELEHPILLKKDKVSGQQQVVNLRIGPITYPNDYVFTRDAERSETFNEDLYVVHTRVTWSTRGQQSFEEVVSYLYYTNEL
jgi:prepilin-type N-terminal cleavage/methylation domain-containing protein